VRIAQYCPLDLTTKGGLQTAVLCLSRALTRLGHEVEVVCQRGEPAAGLPFVSRTAFKPERYDLVHTHAHLCAWPVWLRRRVKRHVHTLHGTTLGLRLACRRPKALLNPQNWRGVAAEAYAAHLADRAIAVSGRARNEAVRLYRVPAWKVSVVYNGYEPAKASPSSATRAQWRRRLALGDGEVMFLFVGRNEDYVKNVRRLLWAYDLTRGQTPRLRVVMAPGGRAAPPGVVATGALSHAEVSELYAAADALVSTSFYEGCSVVIVEAMAAGLTVLATPVGAAPELIEHLSNGVHLAREGRDLPGWMERVAEDAALRRRLGTAGRQAVRRYTWDHIAARTVEVYERTLQGVRQ